jgi:hypothetical protein
MTYCFSLPANDFSWIVELLCLVILFYQLLTGRLVGLRVARRERAKKFWVLFAIEAALVLFMLVLEVLSWEWL